MATLKDVAKEADLAVATVSRILNNRGYISEEAREKVELAMKKLNYRPNELARSLHQSKSTVIGLIVPHITHPFFSEMIRCIEEKAHAYGFRLLLFNTQSSDDNESEFLQICNSQRVAGIIMFSGGLSVQHFKNFGVPVITIERFLEAGTGSIECDNELGGYLAAEHLVSRGCRKILHFGTEKKYEMPGDMRFEGFKKYCKEHKVEYVEIPSKSDSFQTMEYYEDIEKALKKHRDADGIFANNDIIGAQAIQVCDRMGVKIPDDMKIVSFDDTMLTRLTSPQLTSVHQPIKEMAELSVRLLSDAVDGKVVPVRTQLPISLVVREST